MKGMRLSEAIAYLLGDMDPPEDFDVAVRLVCTSALMYEKLRGNVGMAAAQASARAESLIWRDPFGVSP